jgi:hypothetical protein
LPSLERGAECSYPQTYTSELGDTVGVNWLSSDIYANFAEPQPGATNEKSGGRSLRRERAIFHQGHAVGCIKANAIIREPGKNAVHEIPRILCVRVNPSFTIRKSTPAYQHLRTASIIIVASVPPGELTGNQGNIPLCRQSRSDRPLSNHSTLPHVKYAALEI